MCTVGYVLEGSAYAKMRAQSGRSEVVSDPVTDNKEENRYD